MANKATFHLLTPTYPLRSMATVSPLTWIGCLNLSDGHLRRDFPVNMRYPLFTWRNFALKDWMLRYIFSRRLL
jgi:hypothetical protein